MVGLVGAVVGVVPGFLAVLTVLLLGGYVSLMFFQMRQWDARRHGDVAWTDSVDGRQAPAADRPQTAATDGVRLVEGTVAVGTQWEPRETTLPTYTAKSRPQVPRRIDLTHAGWNGASMVEQAPRRRPRSSNSSSGSSQHSSRPWTSRSRTSPTTPTATATTVALSTSSTVSWGDSGAVAQLVARLVRNEKARGSNPLSSTQSH